MSEISGRCYTKFAPYVFFVLVIIDYIVVPVSFIALNFFAMITSDFVFS